MSEDNTLDLLWGAAKIADYLNIPERKCFYILQTRQIPAKKIGDCWVASKKTLQAHFEREEGQR